MGLAEDVQAIAARIPSQIDRLQTEEATKNALVMPFINALGYNVFDPTEVVPEFTADVGTRRGEKVDYAIMENGKPIMLFECKTAGTDLDDAHSSQLFRYFTVTEARFGVLTNGVVYRFHSDLDEPNKMDLRPFLELDLSDLDHSIIEELTRFAKGSFDLDSNIAAASELKYTKEIKRILAQELRQPSEPIVEFFARQIYAGRMTQQVRQRFTEITRQALNQFINDRVFDRLKSAMSTDGTPQIERTQLTEEHQPGQALHITTDEEREGFFVVKAILRGEIDISRIAMRDVQTYCGILLDDNNRKPICRLRFNSAQKYLVPCQQ